MLVSHNRPRFYLRVWSKARYRRATRFSGSPRGPNDDRCRGRRTALPAGIPRRRPACAPIPALSPVGNPRSARSSRRQATATQGSLRPARLPPGPDSARSPSAGSRARATRSCPSISSTRPATPSGSPSRTVSDSSAFRPEPGQPLSCATIRCQGRPARTTTGSASSASRTGPASG